MYNYCCDQHMYPRQVPPTSSTPLSSPLHNTSTSVDKPSQPSATHPRRFTTPNLSAISRHGPLLKQQPLSSYGRSKQPLASYGRSKQPLANYGHKPITNNRSLGTQYNPVDLTSSPLATPTTVAPSTHSSVHRYPFSSTPYPSSRQLGTNHGNDPERPLSPLLPSISLGSSSMI